MHKKKKRTTFRSRGFLAYTWNNCKCHACARGFGGWFW